MGIVYENKLDYDKAINSYLKSIDINPKCRMSLIGLADTHHYNRLYDKSVEYYERIKSIYPEFLFP
jgi:tetratricopeptide (TPR) repeat protein